MSDKKNRVLVCLSGGIDSTASALLLKNKGYEVIGVTFIIYDKRRESCTSKVTGCCDDESIIRVKEIASKININHYLLDYRDYFENTVIKNFILEYSKGRTPNPCVLCNYEIKWKKILEFANSIGCDYIATGHYARVYFKSNRFILASGVDTNKDQSYFLWMLNQEMLSKTLFPLGDKYKNDVKAYLKHYGLLNVVNKRESQEICFIPDNNYRKFIDVYFDKFNIDNKKGFFIDENGKIIDSHKGIAYYTIGQRKNLNISMGERRYVKKIDYSSGNITLSKYDDLLNKSFVVKDLNFVAVDNFKKNEIFSVKVRYRTPAIKVKITSFMGGAAVIEPLENIYAVTPGQSAVFYNDNKEVVAGGIIEEVYE